MNQTCDAATPPPDGQRFEDLLVRLLDELEAGNTTAVESLCQSHPDLAPRLREHAKRLDQLGLLAALDARAEAGLPPQLGDYRPLARLGGGGMGMVFMAEQVSLGRRVALKVIRPEQLYFTGARERFTREVQAIARLQHPGIVPVHDAGESQGLPWLAMELVEGASLDEVLTALQGREPERLTGADLEAAVKKVVGARRGNDVRSSSGTGARPPLFTGTWVQACLRIARAVAEALAHAHERGVLHRDVKPSNVMLTPDGRALLLDFGLALSDGSARMTADQSLLGSPAYMSPEQVRAERDLDARTDVWSLGVTLCELLTLHAPFAADSAERTRALVLAAQTPQVRRRNPAVPRDVELVCATAMSGEARHRYPDMAAFARDLDNLLELRPVHARPPSRALVLRRWVQRRPAAAMALLLAVMALVVAPTVFALQQRAANQEIRVALAETRRHRDAAREAVHVLLTRVSSEELLNVPHMQQLRRDLLAAARGFHERFLAEAAADPELLEQAADSAVQMAYVDFEMGKAQETLASAQRAVALAKALVEQRGEQSLALLAEAIGMRGGAEHALGQYATASASFREAVAARKRVVELAPEAEAQTSLLLSLRNAVQPLDKLDDVDGVLQLYREFRELWQELSAGRQVAALPLTLRETAIAAFSDQVQFLANNGRGEEAAEIAARVMGWSQELQGTKLSPTERLAIGRTHAVRSTLALRQGDAAAAEAHLRLSLAEAEAVLEELPLHANALRVKALVLNNLAYALKGDRSRIAETRDLYAASIANLRKLNAVDPEFVAHRINLARSLVNLATIHDALGELPKARALHEEAIGIAQGVIDQAPADGEAAKSLHDGLWHLGNVTGQMGDHRAQVAAAERLAAFAKDARSQRIAGSLVAQACTLIAKDETLPAGERTQLLESRQQLALQLLKQAAELGCADHRYLETHDHLAAVRPLPDFAAIVVRMAQNAARK